MSGVRPPICYLHIGFEKTGSTSIQGFLTENAERLRAQGVLVPQTLARSDGFRSHIGLTACALDDDKTEDDLRQHFAVGSREELLGFRQQASERLRQELDAAPGTGTLVLSDEHLSSRLERLQEVVRVRQMLARLCREVRVVAYVRNQADLLESIYNEALKNGFHDFDLVPDFEPGQPNSWISRTYFDFHATLLRWAQVFGNDRITVRVFDPDTLQQGDVVRDFAALAGLDVGPLVFPPRLNEGLDLRAQSFLLNMNHELAALPPGEAFRIRDTLVSILMERCRGRGRQLAAGEAERFMAQFRTGNEMLRRQWLPGRPILFRDRPRDEHPSDGTSLPEAFGVMRTVLQSLVARS
jgi:hypothetical protein